MTILSFLVIEKQTRGTKKNLKVLRMPFSSVDNNELISSNPPRKPTIIMYSLMFLFSVDLSFLFRHCLWTAVCWVICVLEILCVCVRVQARLCVCACVRVCVWLHECVSRRTLYSSLKETQRLKQVL